MVENVYWFYLIVSTLGVFAAKILGNQQASKIFKAILFLTKIIIEMSGSEIEPALLRPLEANAWIRVLFFINNPWNSVNFIKQNSWPKLYFMKFTYLSNYEML